MFTVSSLNYIWDDERNRRSGKALEKIDAERNEALKEMLAGLVSMIASLLLTHNELRRARVSQPPS